ncbi:MAG TPA: hypothetical protein VEY87_00840 [Gaiellaceae bacterium]|nr:hypothetical protein [Gaiellaceae bacterium]
MTNNPEHAWIARTEALVREVNERIAESAERFEADEAEFVRECGDPTCSRRVAATLDEYEEVRRESTTFLLAAGHADERVEDVVHWMPTHTVVEKRHPLVATLVRQLDPRAA